MKYPVLLPNIFNHPFTYESDISLKVGDYVVVPFGKSKITGVVWDEFEKKSNKNFETKKVLKKLRVYLTFFHQAKTVDTKYFYKQFNFLLSMPRMCQ